MNELIDKEKHNKKIFKKSLQIKEHASKKLGDPVTYFHQMYEFFLADLEECAKQLYEKAVSQKKLKASKLKPEELKKIISDGLKELVPNYERTMNGYNMGGLLRNYEKFDEDKKQFIVDAEDKITDLSNRLYIQYIDSLNKEKRQFWTFWVAIVSAFISIISLMYTIISGYLIENKELGHEKEYPKTQIESTYLSI